MKEGRKEENSGRKRDNSWFVNVSVWFVVRSEVWKKDVDEGEKRGNFEKNINRSSIRKEVYNRSKKDGKKRYRRKSRRVFIIISFNESIQPI